MKSRNRLRQPFFVSILLVLYSLWAFMRVKGSESIPLYHMALLYENGRCGVSAPSRRRSALPGSLVRQSLLRYNSAMRMALSMRHTGASA